MPKMLQGWPGLKRRSSNIPQADQWAAELANNTIIRV